MKIANLVAYIILVLTGIIILIDGFFGVEIMLNIDTVTVLREIVYILIGLSAVWFVFAAITNKGIISIAPKS